MMELPTLTPDNRVVAAAEQNRLGPWIKCYIILLKFGFKMRIVLVLRAQAYFRATPSSTSATSSHLSVALSIYS